MADAKTQITAQPVVDFLATIEHETRAEDARVLDQMFRRITEFNPKMWGPTIIGYGQYHYIYDSGREGDNCATGFSPRKGALSLYIMPGYQNFDAMLARLGKYKIGKACLYINKLSDIDMDVLEEIVRAGLKDLDAIWPITPT